MFRTPTDPVSALQRSRSSFHLDGSKEEDSSKNLPWRQEIQEIMAPMQDTSTNRSFNKSSQWHIQQLSVMILIQEMSLQTDLTGTPWKMPSLRSYDPPPSDGGTSPHRAVPSLLQLLLLAPPLAASSLHPSLPNTTHWRKKAPRPCQSHGALSSRHSHNLWSLPLTHPRRGTWLLPMFEALAHHPSPASHPLDSLLHGGFVAASVWRQTRRSAHTQNQRTWMRLGFLTQRPCPYSGVEEVRFPIFKSKLLLPLCGKQIIQMIPV